MFIYLITNKVTGKVYVGQHKGDDLQHYLQQKFYEAEHRLKARSHLYASIRKHGRDAFSIQPLVSDIQTREELNQKEKEFIELYDSRNPEVGYNICEGGEGFTGPHTSEAKAKVTEALKQRWAQPGFKEHWTELMTGHDVSPETVDKIKTARADQDEPQRLSAWNEWKEQKLAVDPDHFKKIGAAASREDKARAGRMGSREDKQKAGRIAAKSLPKAIHIRWHVNRGKTNPECLLCGS